MLGRHALQIQSETSNADFTVYLVSLLKPSPTIFTPQFQGHWWFKPSRVPNFWQLIPGIPGVNLEYSCIVAHFVYFRHIRKIPLYPPGIFLPGVDPGKKNMGYLLSNVNKQCKICELWKSCHGGGGGGAGTPGILTKNAPSYGNLTIPWVYPRW
jgi:hypothetical protein